MTMRFRAAMALLLGLACACVAWAQEAVQAEGVQADPKVWGVYATLAGQERQQEGETQTYIMRWHWLEPGAQLREEYIVPSTGKLAHFNTITPGPTPGTLHLKASYMGGKEWNGTLDADGTVHWVGKGLFKLRYAVGPGPGGALLYGMEGQEPMRYMRVDGGADAALATSATAQAPAAQPQSAAELEAMAAQLQARAQAMRQAEAAQTQLEQTARNAEEAARVAAEAAAQARAAADEAARVRAQGGTVATPAAAPAPAPSTYAPTPAPAAAPAVASAPVAPAAPAPAAAPASPTDGFTPGTYMLDGGSYLIEVLRDGDGLLVVEPNKRSPYAWQGGRDFHFYNPSTDTTYGIRVVDARTIEAYKPFVDGNVPSRLTLLSAAADATAPATPQEDLGDPGFEAIAEKYAAMIETDPANIQSWTACAGAAMKYGTATREEADAYARQMIGMLRMMDAQSTPCEDALPSRLW